jgi:hypothetical protein
MNREEFETALAAYGADFARWPVGLAERARMLVANDLKAAAYLAEARQLDLLLSQAVTPAPVDAATIGRIIAGVSANHHHETAVEPTGRLFAWAGAAMAIFLVAGFVIGLALPSIGDDNDSLGVLMFGAETIDGEIL